MEFKILKYRDGKEYPNHYQDGKCEVYVKRVENMEKRYEISLPKITEVIVGDSEYPMTEIYFEGGLMLIDEEASPWLRLENVKKIEELFKS